MLVFFDILHLDGVDLLHQIYRDRRRVLELKVTTQVGKVMIAQQKEIGDPDISPTQTLQNLRQTFSESRSNFEGTEI